MVFGIIVALIPLYSNRSTLFSNNYLPKGARRTKLLTIEAMRTEEYTQKHEFIGLIVMYTIHHVGQVMRSQNWRLRIPKAWSA